MSSSMSGKTVLVTGGTGGIGRSTALGLARLGADVAITGRDVPTAERAAAEIRAATGARVEVFTADLSLQSEVRRLATEVLDRLPRLDVLVNNVGGYWHTRHLTSDGIERTFALNHLAPFLLTRLLLERMGQSGQARVVTVSSHAHAQGRIDFADLMGADSYSGARAYSQSKLANLLFTYELARRVRYRPVCAHAVHPGLVSTSFGAEDPGRTQRVLVPLIRPFMKGADRGAATSVHAASAEELQGTTAGYFVNRRARRSSPRSYDEPAAGRLWRESSDMVGLPAGP
jgi:retinol dehydrogenase 14